MTNLQSRPKVVPELTVSSARTGNTVRDEDSLESLRHNQTHTLPPGARVAWLSHRLEDLPEEHLRATDDLSREAAKNAAEVSSDEGLEARRARGRVPLVYIAVVGAVLGGAIAVYFLSGATQSAEHGTQVTTPLNPTLDTNAPTKTQETGDSAHETATQGKASEPTTVTPATATPPPAASPSERPEQQHTTAPRLTARPALDKPKQPTMRRKLPEKPDAPAAEPKPGVDEILFKSR
ncbi:MAG TPA: hypothetical protein VKP30_02930 [Polyangiaceae bacterium]|nr:hypothetical protein [Polyangiaceae bacterium]